MSTPTRPPRKPQDSSPLSASARSVRPSALVVSTAQCVSDSEAAGQHGLKVKFPDFRDNIIRKNIEIVLSELQSAHETTARDNSRVKQLVDEVSNLASTLGDQISQPVEVLDPVSAGVRYAQRTARRIATEDAVLREMPPQMGDGIIHHPVNPTRDVVVDEPSEKKLRLLMDMLTQSCAEVTRLREELTTNQGKLFLKDNRILELEATVHSSNLSMTAMELAMTKLKRKAAMGGGGGGFRGSNAPATAVPGAPTPSAALSASISVAAPSSLLGTASAALSVGEGMSERVAVARRSIMADRRRWLAETPTCLQVDQLGQDFGPRGRIALVVVWVPNFSSIADRYPEVADTVLDVLRDSVRGMLEVSDGFEFRQTQSMFGCAFDDCTSALDFSLNLVNHLHNGATWPKELDMLEEFKMVPQDNGMSLFHGLRVSIGVHTGLWSGNVDLLCQRKTYIGDLLDRTTIISRSCPPGLIMVSNDVLAATGVREFIASKSIQVTPIPPWGVNVVITELLKERVTKARAAPDAPLAKADILTLVAMDAAATPPVSKAILCIQVEGFLNTLIEGDVPSKDLYRSATMLETFIQSELQWCSQRSAELPVITRQEGGDKYVILMSSLVDAVDLALSLQQDTMRLPWPSNLLDAAIGFTEHADVPDSHRLYLTPNANSVQTVLAFRGLRLQMGIHFCTCTNGNLVDWFNHLPRWNIPEVNIPIGLSCIARGGEVILSATAKEGLIDELRHAKEDTRLSSMITNKISKKVSVPGIPDAFDAFYAASQATVYRFRDSFPEPVVARKFRFADYGVHSGCYGEGTALVALAISHGPLLQSTNAEAYEASQSAIVHLVALCLRRFNGMECQYSDEVSSATSAHVMLLVFPDLPRAALAATFLHEVAMQIPLDPSLEGTPFTLRRNGTDNKLLYSGLRLKIGICDGRAILTRLPPNASRPVAAGHSVRKAVALCWKAPAGTSLLSSIAAQQLEAFLASSSVSNWYLYELIDYIVDGVTQKGNFQLMLPLPLKERAIVFSANISANSSVTSPDSVDSVLCAIIKSLDRSLDDLTIMTTLKNPPPLYDSDSCVVSGGSQMFVVCRLPGVSGFMERAPQFGKDLLKIYLQCARELLTPLKGRELESDGDALLLRFESAVHAVQWAQQLQVSLVCAKWPVEMLSTDFCKEVRSTTKSGGAGRVGSLFRGPRALVVMDWGIPKRRLDTSKQRWMYFGEVFQCAIDLCHWGHGGQIILSKRAKAAIVQELTNEATKQMLESPNISSVGTRAVRAVRPVALDASIAPSAAASQNMVTVDASEGEPLFSLTPLLFFERTYPPFPESASEERRFASATERMLQIENEEAECTTNCILVLTTALPRRAKSLDFTGTYDSAEGLGQGIVGPGGPDTTVANSAVVSAQTSNEATPADASLQTNQAHLVVSLGADQVAALSALLPLYSGKLIRTHTAGVTLQFPLPVDAICFCLALSSSSGLAWARDVMFGIDSRSIDALATTVAPFGSAGEIVLSEETLSTMNEGQSKLLRGFTMGRQAVLDATSAEEDVDAPPLRLVALCPLALTSAASARRCGSENAMEMQFPSEIWQKPEPVAKRSKRVADGGKQEASTTADDAVSNETGDGQDASITDIASPFVRNETDIALAASIDQLLNARNASELQDEDGLRDQNSLLLEAADTIQRLWDDLRQQATQDQRRIQQAEALTTELTQKIEKYEANQKLSSELLLRSHRIIRQYRSKLDVFFKKAMVEETVYSNDADLFVTDWIAATKVINAASGTTAASSSGGSKQARATFLSPREEFAMMMRQSIEDDGTESRANPTRLFGSLVGHMGKVFTAIEKLLKQRERISRVGAVHRKQSTRFPPERPSLSPPEARRASVAPPSTLIGGGEGSGDPADERRRSIKSKLRSVVLLGGGELGRLSQTVPATASLANSQEGARPSTSNGSSSASPTTR